MKHVKNVAKIFFAAFLAGVIIKVLPPDYQQGVVILLLILLAWDMWE